MLWPKLARRGKFWSVDVNFTEAVDLEDQLETGNGAAVHIIFSLASNSQRNS